MEGVEEVGLQVEVERRMRGLSLHDIPPRSLGTKLGWMEVDQEKEVGGVYGVELGCAVEG